MDAVSNLRTSDGSLCRYGLSYRSSAKAAAKVETVARKKEIRSPLGQYPLFELPVPQGESCPASSELSNPATYVPSLVAMMIDRLSGPEQYGLWLACRKLGSM